jgi:hypothetical protein
MIDFQHEQLSGRSNFRVNGESRFEGRSHLPGTVRMHDVPGLAFVFCFPESSAVAVRKFHGGNLGLLLGGEGPLVLLERLDFRRLSQQVFYDFMGSHGLTTVQMAEGTGLEPVQVLPWLWFSKPASYHSINLPESEATRQSEPCRVAGTRGRATCVPAYLPSPCGGAKSFHA